MSLLRLLAAGKSLIGLKDRVGRYRESSQNRLPKFEPATNPFRATTLPSGGIVRESADSVPQAESEGPAEARSGSRAFQRVARFFAPRLRVAPPVERRPVQTELALDRVKVVRNDLLDADLEVVPARQGRTKPVAEAPAPAANVASVASAPDVSVKT